MRTKAAWPSESEFHPNVADWDQRKDDALAAVREAVEEGDVGKLGRGPTTRMVADRLGVHRESTTRALMRAEDGGEVERVQEVTNDGPTRAWRPVE